ncbi:hypothetical protein CDL12_22066 [Handroanthus impetiginosus]|uniref:MSP domain-containing protein n=1 Tax=Handroanthus impetiginosus TaxID=429701 RepID=A0A2G9GJL5_9LAMI|nr:hypothetical protein CDL12_22066 [Handroanthus impetiginosus]
MVGGEVLDVHPSELRFPFEVKELSCSLQISNATENYVGFNVKATNPDNYSVQPNIGILGPQSTCDIKVRIRAQTEIPLNMKCKDQFLIQSTVATTKNITRQMFNSRTGTVDVFKLGVLYVTPTSLLYSKITDWLDENEGTFGGLFMKGITIGLLFLMFWYLMMKLLSLIWSLTFVIMMFVIKMIKSEVSDKVEGWIVKCLATVCIHFSYVVFRRVTNMSIT